MHLTYRNVNDAFYGLITGMNNGGFKTRTTTSRAGDVLMIDEPVTVTYSRPLERVLFSQARDANPFFHLYESLWMLAGRNDVKALQHYNSKIADYSDDGWIFNGAYGYRWRHAKGATIEVETGLGTYPKEQETDQLRVIIDHLKGQPNSRRCVLQMWNVEDDLLKIDTTKDCCCNTHVYFSLRQEIDHLEADGWSEQGSAVYKRVLDMTVCNRSNDLIWGMLGANVVHFSFLQEYIAAHLGAQVGTYNQFTNNLHVYTNTNSGWEPQKYLAEVRHRTMRSPPRIEYGKGLLSPEVEWSVPLVRDPETFDRELPHFVAYGPNQLWSEPFLADVARPMCQAFVHHKNREYMDALMMIERVKAVDWMLAGRNWLLKRKQNWEAKNA